MLPLRGRRGRRGGDAGGEASGEGARWVFAVGVWEIRWWNKQVVILLVFLFVWSKMTFIFQDDFFMFWLFFSFGRPGNDFCEA